MSAVEKAQTLIVNSNAARICELLATERRYQAMVENGWFVQNVRGIYFVYRGGMLAFVASGTTPEEAIDAALEKLEGK